MHHRIAFRIKIRRDHKVKICGRSPTTEIKTATAEDPEMEATITIEAAKDEDSAEAMTEEALTEVMKAATEEEEAISEEEEALGVALMEEIVIHQVMVAVEGDNHLVVDGMLKLKMERATQIQMLGVLKMPTWKTKRKMQDSEGHQLEMRSHSEQDPTKVNGRLHLLSKKNALSGLQHNQMHYYGEIHLLRMRKRRMKMPLATRTHSQQHRGAHQLKLSQKKITSMLGETQSPRYKMQRWKKNLDQTNV